MISIESVTHITSPGIRMNYSELERMSDEDVRLIFKGIFRDLSFIQIPLSLIVIVQNSIIFKNYYKDRAKFVPSLFMGIALSDILKAQGQLVLGVISILAYSELVDIMVLYKSLIYYMITALPGINCSKLFNMVLTITLTYNIVDPFRVVNTAFLKKVVLCLCLVITFLHVSDSIISIYALIMNILHAYVGATVFLFLILCFDVPGCVVLAAILCQNDNTGQSRCSENLLVQRIFGGSLLFLYFVAIPLTVLICMMIQVKYLRRSLGDTETTTLPNTSRHVSITVFLVSTLFFVCNVTYFLLVTTWFISHQNINYEEQTDRYYVDLGIQVWQLFFKMNIFAINRTFLFTLLVLLVIIFIID